MLVQTALFQGQFSTIQVITAKSALLYFHCIDFKHFAISNLNSMEIPNSCEASLDGKVSELSSLTVSNIIK